MNSCYTVLLLLKEASILKKHKLFYRVFAYIAVVVCLFFLLKNSGYSISDINPEMIRELAHDNVLLILLIMLIIMLLQNLFTFIPLVLVIATNITLFGFWYGYLFSTLCSVAGSTIIFLSIRLFFKDTFSNSKTAKYREKLEKRGFIFVLAGRILPFMPTNLINIASAVSSIKMSHFIAATTIGNMIYGLFLASASFSIILAIVHHPIYAVLAALFIVTIIFFIRHKKHQKKLEILQLNPAQIINNEKNESHSA